MIYSIISTIVLLVICPFAVGNVLSFRLPDDLKNNPVFHYVIGFVGMNGIWYLILLPIKLICPQKPFHFVCDIFYSIIALVVVIRMIIFVKGCKTREKNSYSRFRIRLQELIASDYVCYYIIFTVIAFYQLFRVIFWSRWEYTDDMTYLVHINDMVYTDQFFPKDIYGAVSSNNNGESYKLLYAGWTEYLVMLVRTIRAHSLIICKTIMPVALIVLFYATMYVFYLYLWEKDKKSVAVAMASTAFVNECVRYVCFLSFMQLYGTTWGKWLVGSIMAPLMIMLFNRAMEEKKWKSYTVLFVVGLACASFSTASLVIISILLFFQMVIGIYKYKTAKVVVIAFCLEVPMLMQGVLYLKGIGL